MRPTLASKFIELVEKHPEQLGELVQHFGGIPEINEEGTFFYFPDNTHAAIYNDRPGEWLML